MTTELGFEVRDPHEGATEARNEASSGPRRVEVPEPEETTENDAEADTVPSVGRVVAEYESATGRKMALNQKADVAAYLARCRAMNGEEEGSTPSGPAERSRQRRKARNRKAKDYGELPFDVRSPWDSS